MATRTLTLIVRGDVREALSRIKTLKGAVAGLGLGIAAGAVAGVVALGKLGDEFDNAFDTIQQNTGATGRNLKTLKEDFRAVFKSTVTNSEDAAKAISGVNQMLGHTGRPLRTLSRQFLDLTRLTETDLQQNVTDISRVFRDWSVASGQQSGTMDRLYRATQLSGIGINRLSGLVVQFGAPMRQLGFSLDESIALFAEFHEQGVNTETVMSGLRRGLSNMAKAGEEPRETFRRVVEEIKNTGSAAEANRLALEMFGSRAGPDMAAAIREGRFAIDDMVGALSNSQGAIRNTARETDDWREKWQLFANRLKTELEPLAAEVFDFLGEKMEELGPHIDNLARWIREDLGPAAREFGRFVSEEVAPKVRRLGEVIRDDVMPQLRRLSNFFKNNELSQDIAGWAAAIGALALAGLKLAGPIGAAGGALMKLGGILSRLRVLLIANPIGSVIFALTIAASKWREALDTIVYQWQGAREQLGDIAGGFREFSAKIPGYIGDGMRAAGAGMVRGFKEAWRQLEVVFVDIPNRITRFFQRADEWLVSGGKDILGGIVAGLRFAWEGLRLFFVELPQRVVGTIKRVFGIGSPATIMIPLGRDILRGIVVGVRAIWTEVLGPWFMGMPGRVRAFFSGAIGWLVTGGRNIIGGLSSGITNRWVALREWFGRIPGAIRSAFSGSGGWLANIGKNIITGLWDGMKSVWRQAREWFGNLKDAVVGIIKRVFGISSPAKVMVPLGGHIVSGLVKGLVTSGPALTSVVRSLGLSTTKAMELAFGAVGNIVGNIGGAIGNALGGRGFSNLPQSVMRWATLASRALQAEGQFDIFNLYSLLRRMNQESGGNPYAVNRWDSNARRGDPTMGLMQHIPSAFQSRLPPHLKGASIFDPYANILASIRYAMQRYGSIRAAYDRKGGYAKGAWRIPQDELAMIHRNEMVVPARIAEGVRESLLGMTGAPQPTTQNTFNIVNGQPMDVNDLTRMIEWRVKLRT